ncbi:MAG: type II secretion system GspH family protein [Phycisphaerales bacterium]|nr:type II secretion system GspH family protein [Phycisphaerales bacterium]
MTQNASGVRAAFTLIELLVTIAIIAVLMAILFPALSGARAAAKQTDCLNDMHNIALALNIYCNDFRESLPYPNWGPAAPFKGWLYGPGINTQAATPNDRQTGALWPYVEADRIYRCPSHKPPYAGTANMTSYMMNGAVVGYGRFPAPLRIGQMQGDAVVLWDGNEQPEFGPPYNDGASFPFEIVPGHHANAVTCAVVDGSTVVLPTIDFFALRDATVANRFWCVPNSPNGR